MNYQRKSELEDFYIEVNGQHPLWVYERQVKGKENISYDEFLTRACSGYETVEYAPEGKTFFDIPQKDQEDDLPETAIIVEEFKKDFESFSKINHALIKETSARLGQHTYHLFKKIRDFSVDEWAHSSESFLQWLNEEMNISEGKSLIQLDPLKPYGPDNCMLAGVDLFLPINEKHHTNFDAQYRNMRTKHRTSEFADEWKTKMHFLHWLQRHEGELPDYAIISRIDSSKPFGPDNCTFDKNVRNRKCQKQSMELDDLIERVTEIGKKYGVNPVSKYMTLSKSKQLSESSWRFDKYLEWVYEQASNDEFAPYLNRLDRSKPYSPSNCYYSWRLRSQETHGMSNTKLYRKYTYFVKYYRERIQEKDKVSFEEFMDYVLKYKDYQLNSRMSVQPSGKYVTMEDIQFTEDNDDMDDIIRICEVYQTIPKHLNEFGELMDFMEWTIRQGYQPWMDFKRIGEGSYSPKTCVWDIFTENAYIISKGRRVLKIYEKVKQ